MAGLQRRQILLTSHECGITPRSSGAPTAGHQARAGSTVYIFASPGLASYRRRPLSSNVRQRKAMHPLLLLHTQDTGAVKHRRFCRARRGVGALAPSLCRRAAPRVLAARPAARETRRRSTHRTTMLGRKYAFQSIRWAAASSISAVGAYVERRLEYRASHGCQRGAGGTCS